MRLDKKYIILLASITIAVAVVINQQILAQNTYKPFYDNIINYCFNHVDKILAGQNPVKDLLKAGLIPPNFNNMTCTEVTNEALGSPQNGNVQNGNVQNGNVQNSSPQNGNVQNSSLQNGTVQNGSIQNSKK
jgi:hypothetical protein